MPTSVSCNEALLKDVRGAHSRGARRLPRLCWDGYVARRVTWTEYCSSIGDRSPLFAAVADRWPVELALYPGSYVDWVQKTGVEAPGVHR